MTTFIQQYIDDFKQMTAFLDHPPVNAETDFVVGDSIFYKRHCQFTDQPLYVCSPLDAKVFSYEDAQSMRKTLEPVNGESPMVQNLRGAVEARYEITKYILRAWRIDELAL